MGLPDRATLCIRVKPHHQWVPTSSEREERHIVIHFAIWDAILQLNPAHFSSIDKSRTTAKNSTRVIHRLELFFGLFDVRQEVGFRQRHRHQVHHNACNSLIITPNCFGQALVLKALLHLCLRQRFIGAWEVNGDLSIQDFPRYEGRSGWINRLKNKKIR